MNLLIQYIIVNAINIVTSTVKSISTVKSGKFMAALTNAISYSINVIAIVYMVSDLPLFQKAIIIGLENFVFVYIVKWLEEKARKDKMWKVEATVGANESITLRQQLKACGIPFYYNEITPNKIVYSIFCATQAESAKAKELLYACHAKYFVSESQTL